MSERAMPRPIDLGQNFAGTMAHPMGVQKEYETTKHNPFGYRVVMGFFLPPWQRGLVWTEAQQVSFIESAWRGIPLGTYTYNQTDYDSPLDNLLIDGQQRMHSIERYLRGDFPVLGWRYADLPIADRRRWAMTVTFAAYKCASDDEDYLKGYYNLMNFGGVSHRPEERAA